MLLLHLFLQLLLNLLILALEELLSNFTTEVDLMFGLKISGSPFFVECHGYFVCVLAMSHVIFPTRYSFRRRVHRFSQGTQPCGPWTFAISLVMKLTLVVEPVFQPLHTTVSSVLFPF